MILIHLISIAIAMSNNSAITLYHPHGPITQSALEYVAKIYFNRTGIEVEIVDIGWGNLFGEIMSYENDNVVSADIITAGSTWMSELYIKGILVPMGEYYKKWRTKRKNLGSIEKEFVKNLEYTYSFPKIIEDKSSLPEWHAVPLDVDSRVLFYRKDLFMKWLKNDNPPKTLDDAIKAGQLIYNGENGKVNGLGLPSIGNDVFQILLTFIVGNGSSFVGPQESCSFTNEYFKSSFQRYASLYKTQHNYSKGDSLTIANEFAEGKVAMVTGGAWQYPNLIGKNITSNQVGITSIPAGPAGPYTFQGGSGWIIPTNVPEAKRDQVFDFLSYFSDPSNNYLKDITIAKGLVPGYETSIRNGKETFADGVQLGEIIFYDALNNIKNTLPSMFSNPEGITDNEHRVGNLATNQKGDWIDKNKAINPYFIIDFGFILKLSGYKFITGSLPGFERDPIRWSVYYYENSSWLFMHEHYSEYMMSNDGGLRNTSNPNKIKMDPNKYSYKYKFIFTEFREQLCKEACKKVIDVFPFAIPLQYPEQGFYKLARLEQNKTITNMLSRLYNGESIDVVTKQGCVYWDILMKDNNKKTPRQATTIIIGLILGILLFGVIYLCVKNRNTTKKMDKLKSQNEMAEDLANGIANMHLESCEYLFDLEKPNKIQKSFITIIRTLKDYRTYLPSNLRDQNDSDPYETEESELPTPSHASSNRLSRISPKSDSKRPDLIDVFQLALIRKNISVLLINIVDWDGAIANRSIDETIDLYKSYISTISNVTTLNNGVIYSMSGDKVLISFNATKNCTSHTNNAINVIFDMPDIGLKLSYGCATEICQIGNLGTETIRRFSILGNVIAYATKYEEIAKQRFKKCVVDYNIMQYTQCIYDLEIIGEIIYKRKNILIASIVDKYVIPPNEINEEWVYHIGKFTDKNRKINKYNDFVKSIILNKFDVEVPEDVPLSNPFVQCKRNEKYNNLNLDNNLSDGIIKLEI